MIGPRAKRNLNGIPCAQTWFPLSRGERNEMLRSPSRYYPSARALVSARTRNYDVAPCPRVENEGEPQTRAGRPPASVPTSIFEGDGHEASPPRISAFRRGCRRAPGRRGARERTELPHAAGAPDPWLSRRRFDRPGGAHHGRVAHRAPRPIRRRREQAGGGTNLAAQAAINSPPDGYTLLFVTTTNAINATFYPTLPFNVLRDVAPVAGLVDLPFVMEVNPSVPAATVAEFIAHAKANPGKINMASFGTGTISHLAWELFKLMTGVDTVHVPYHGGAPMVTDLIGGRVEAGIDALPNSLPHIRSGTLRALAVTGPARSAAVPDVPTVGETVPGYEVSGWTGIGVPAGTPAAIVATLNREINAGLADARIAARLAEVGGRPILATPDQFGQLWLRDTDKWAKVVKFAAAKR